MLRDKWFHQTIKILTEISKIIKLFP